MTVRYRRAEGFVVRALGPRNVLVPVHAPVPHDVLMFLLDGPVAEHIWELLAEPRSHAELVASVLQAFEAEPGVVSAEVETYLEQLGTLGAVEQLPAP